ncbi:MAG: DUF6882 domain-containing protein [Ardenticatenaceae bacterium]
MSLGQFIDQSMYGLRLQTKAHSSAWQLGQEESWDIDQNNGTISFTFANGVVATAPVQIVGTHNPVDGTFLWGWANPSIHKRLTAHADLVKQYGSQNQVSLFVREQVKCTEDEAWAFTAVAVRLAKANGAYRANAEGPWVYVTFGKVTLNN